MKKPIITRQLFCRIMKLTVFQFVLALVFSNVALANNTRGQEKLDTKISITVTDLSLNTTLTKIGKR